MKTEDGKTTRIGKEQSAKTNEKDGPSPMTESKEKDCGEIIRGIEKIGNLIGGRSISTTLDFIRLYGMPAERKAAVWQIDIEKFKSWAADLGWNRQMSESELKIQVRQKALQEAGPGKVIEGTLQHLAKRLYTDTGTLSSYRKQIDCPIQKNDDNTYRVDLHAWELFQIKYRVGEYRLTGNQKGRISWT
jgi:hypothetical protein